MGEEDIHRQALNVFRMKLLGAKVVPVESGSRTLKDALNDAIRDWIANVEDTHYLIGTAAGPHPYPYLVRRLQAVIGEEARAQLLEHYRRYMIGMKAMQAPDGMWRQVVDEPGAYREESVTAMTLTAMARGLRRAGKGVIQLLDDFGDTTPDGSTEFAMLRRLVEASGRPLW